MDAIKDFVENYPKYSSSQCSCTRCDTIRCYTQKPCTNKDSINAKTYVFFSNKTIHHVASQAGGSAKFKDFETKETSPTDLQKNLIKSKTVSCCANKLDFEIILPAKETEGKTLNDCTASKGDAKHDYDSEASTTRKPNQCSICKGKLKNFNFERKTSAPANIMKHSIENTVGSSFTSKCNNKHKTHEPDFMKISVKSKVDSSSVVECNLKPMTSQKAYVTKDSMKSKQDFCSTIECGFKFKTPEFADFVKETVQSKNNLHYKNKCDYEHKMPESVDDKDEVIDNPHKHDLQSTLKQYQCSYKVIPKSNDETVDFVSHSIVRTAADSYPHNVLNPRAAELSAQIMDFSYHDLPESISRHQSDEFLDRRIRKLSKYDIVSRITEAYKACSCKCCECIASQPICPKNSCNCEPCACKDCLSMTREKKITYLLLLDYLTKKNCNCEPCSCNDCRSIVREKCERLPSPGCPCIRCDRSDCKGIVLSNVTNEKNAALNSIIATPVKVADENQGNLCQCTPCDCDECKHSNVCPLCVSTTREISTEMTNTFNCSCKNCEQTCAPAGLDDCPCKRANNAIIKPVKKDTIEYDIRRATVSNNIADNLGDKGMSKRDFEAMFSVVSNNYLRHQSNEIACDCGECACLICNCKEKSNPISNLLNPSRSWSISCKKMNSAYKISTPSQTCKGTTTVEKEVKTSNTSIEILHHQQNYTLQNKMLHSPSLKQPGTCQHDDDTKLKPSKISCEAVKVRFLEVRRISDHTILVKWEKPIDTVCVKGYELLVDGRPVPKIINPSRCMAVLTCLPHSDKVVLTVRTILNTHAESGHFPSTTVVCYAHAK